MVPVGERARRRVCREVGAQPLLLRRAGHAAARLGAVAVERDEVPGAQVVAVVARAGLAGGGAEVAEVARCARRVVVMVAGDRIRVERLRAPRRRVPRRVLERAAFGVGVVAQREDGVPGDGVEQRCRRRGAGRRRRDVAGGGDHGIGAQERRGVLARPAHVGRRAGGRRRPRPREVGLARDGPRLRDLRPAVAVQVEDRGDHVGARACAAVAEARAPASVRRRGPVHGVRARHEEQHARAPLRRAAPAAAHRCADAVPRRVPSRALLSAASAVVASRRPTIAQSTAPRCRHRRTSVPGPRSPANGSLADPLACRQPVQGPPPPRAWARGEPTR